MFPLLSQYISLNLPWFGEVMNGTTFVKLLPVEDRKFLFYNIFKTIKFVWSSIVTVAFPFIFPFRQISFSGFPFRQISFSGKYPPSSFSTLVMRACFPSNYHFSFFHSSKERKRSTSPFCFYLLKDLFVFPISLISH